MNREDLKQQARDMLRKSEKSYLSAIWYGDSGMLSEAKSAVSSGEDALGNAVLLAAIATLAIPLDNTDEGLAWTEEYGSLREMITVLANIAGRKIKLAG